MDGYLKTNHFLYVLGNKNLDCANTTLERLSSKAMSFDCDKYKGIIYSNTVVFLYNKETQKTFLQNDGRFTNTTKKHINSMLPYGYSLRQKKFNWYITNPDGKDTPRTDGASIDDHIFIL